MSELVGSTGDADFETDVLESKVPVLVDFWAEWCQPCRMLTPILDEVAKEFEGKLKVFKVNIDENSRTPANYQVRSIPSLLLIKDGNKVDMKVGLLSKKDLVDFIKANI